jgi:hypothetical protein
MVDGVFVQIYGKKFTELQNGQNLQDNNLQNYRMNRIYRNIIYRITEWTEFTEWGSSAALSVAYNTLLAF